MSNLTGILSLCFLDVVFFTVIPVLQYMGTLSTADTGACHNHTPFLTMSVYFTVSEHKLPPLTQLALALGIFYSQANLI